jgi:hypothetical protein
MLNKLVETLDGVAFAVDLTEHKRMEAEALESEQRYREMQPDSADRAIGADSVDILSTNEGRRRIDVSFQIRALSPTPMPPRHEILCHLAPMVLSLALRYRWRPPPRMGTPERLAASNLA